MIEKLKNHAGLNTSFYKNNHEKVSKYLCKRISTEKKIKFLESYNLQLLKKQIYWENGKNVADPNSFNSDEIANELLLEFVQKQINTYKIILKGESDHTEVNTNQNKMEVEKLKWLGTPSQFAYILLELAKKGFIEIPATSGEASYSRFAKVCWELISFKEATTQENLKKELNPNKNTLSDGVRAKFTIPQINEISKKKK